MPRARSSVRLKRAYDPPETSDGTRVLVDRLWPRGLAKDAAHIDLWLIDVAPSGELRTWFGHDPERFDEFRRRYREELAAEPGASALARLRALAGDGALTLVFGAKDADHSNAVVLRDLLAEQPRR